jgi:hypothetical protein
VVLEDQLRFIEQPPDQRRLAVVDAAAGDEAQKILVLLLGEIIGDARSLRDRAGASEIAFLFLLLHRGRLVVIDDPPLALRGGGGQHLLDDGEKSVAVLSTAPVSG